MTTTPTTRPWTLPWDQGVPAARADDRVRIVVVCAANAARSPLVARLLQADLDARAPGRFAVSSGGVRVLAGTPMAEGARRILARRGLDGSGHRATPVTATDLRGAALVLTAEEAHAVAVLERAPALLNRTFTVLELAAIARRHRARGMDPARFLEQAGGMRAAVVSSGAELDLLDPVGGDPGRFAALEDQLGDAVHVIADALVATLRAPRG
jgi:protein-tyrosine phosphatase